MEVHLDWDNTPMGRNHRESQRQRPEGPTAPAPGPA
jgi:hypothetical protein